MQEKMHHNHVMLDLAHQSRVQIQIRFDQAHDEEGQEHHGIDGAGYNVEELHVTARPQLIAALALTHGHRYFAVLKARSNTVIVWAGAGAWGHAWSKATQLIRTRQR